MWFIFICFWQFGFMFIALIWKFDFAPFMVLIIAILNDGKIVFVICLTFKIFTLTVLLKILNLFPSPSYI